MKMRPEKIDLLKKYRGRVNKKLEVFK